MGKLTSPASITANDRQRWSLVLANTPRREVRAEGLQELKFLGESDHVFQVMRSVVMSCRSGPSATTLSATDQGAILATAERADAVSDAGPQPRQICVNRQQSPRELVS